MAPSKLLVVNFPINLRCYVLLGYRVINVILAINIGDSAFFDIAALVRQFGGLRHHQQTESIHWPPPNQNPGYATGMKVGSTLLEVGASTSSDEDSVSSEDHLAIRPYNCDATCTDSIMHKSS